MRSKRLRRVAKLAIAGCVVWLALWVFEALLWFCFPLRQGLLDLGLSSRVVLAADGTLMRVTPNRLGERCLPVTLAEVSPHVVSALLAAEDRRFLAHTGVDVRAILRAFGQNLSRGRTFSGASTITMQLARLCESTPHTLLGKAWQALRARQIERAHTKNAILEAYLTGVPFAGNVRGIEAAALLWFGKRAKDLDVVEAATLIAMLPAPGRRSPSRGEDLLLLQRNLVLDAMHAVGSLAALELERARQRPLDAKRHDWPWLAADASEYILGTSSGRELRTAIDLAMQRAAEDVVAHARSLQVSGIAIVVLSRVNGDLVALVGGRRGPGVLLDHALCARPAGSTLKPLLYALALEAGVIGSEGTLSDRPVAFGNYRPSNFSRTFAGETTFADALGDSKNVPAVRLLKQVGVDRFRDWLALLGLFTSDQPLGLDVALGTLSVRPIDLAKAYVAVLAEQGPCTVSEPTRTTLLRALSRRSPDLAWCAVGDIAWKTGTSSDRRDAWSVGITERHVLVVWAGESSGTSHPGLVGARAASELLAPLFAATR